MSNTRAQQVVSGRDAGAVSRGKSVVVELRDMVMRGEFPPGFHLQEIPLAARMNVSRTPIREALNILAKEGLLEPGPKRGYKIRTFSMEEIVEAYEVRATLEGTACRLLAEKGVGGDAQAKLVEALAFGDSLLARGMFGASEQQPWLEMNHTIHSILVESTANSMLIKCLEQTLHVPLASARHVHWYRFDELNFERAKLAHRDHHAIVEAILGRQSARAEARMREHIYFSQALVREHFKNQQIGFGAVALLASQ